MILVSTPQPLHNTKLLATQKKWCKINKSFPKLLLYLKYDDFLAFTESKAKYDAQSKVSRELCQQEFDKKVRLECAVDGVPSQIPTLFC